MAASLRKNIDTPYQRFSMEPSGVARMKLPAALVKNSLGCSFDLGGSRCKYVYIEKSSGTQEEGTVTLCFGWYKIADLQHAVEYVKSKGYCFDATNPPLLHTTGISCRLGNKSVIETKLNARVDNLIEIETFLHGFLKMAHALPKSLVVKRNDVAIKKIDDETGNAVFKCQQEFDSISVHTPSDTAAKRSATDSVHEYGGWDTDLPYSQSDPDLFPCIIGSYGTGHVSCQLNTLVKCGDIIRQIPGQSFDSVIIHPTFIKLLQDGTMRGIDMHFGRSGMTFACLGHVMCGTADYDELMSLAVKGDDSSVHLLMGEVKEPGQNDRYTEVPDWVTLHYFSKYLEARMKGEEVKKEHLARGLVNFMASEIAHQVFWYARAYSCRRVFLIGGLFKHELMQSYVTREFVTANHCRPVGTPSTEIYFPQFGEFVGVLGTLCGASDHYNKLESDK